MIQGWETIMVAWREVLSSTINDTRRFVPIAAAWQKEKQRTHTQTYLDTRRTNRRRAQPRWIKYSTREGDKSEALMRVEYLPAATE